MDAPTLSAAWPRLVLGSTSVYRRDLLARLNWPFDTQAPHVDETPLAGESPRDLAWRLATLKAQAVAAQCPDDAIIIGSDQVAELDGQAVGKPGGHARATAQLRAMRGRTVRFHTAVSVARPRTGHLETAVNTVDVGFRSLTDSEIDTYLRLEQPYDCAGSAKCEGLGITLLEHIDSDDPTSLIGLPLILTCRMLAAGGLPILAAHATRTSPLPHRF